jgi:hypothetical protein
METQTYRESIGPSYPAARRVAEIVHPKFQHLFNDANSDGLLAVPASSISVADIEEMIDAAFWASLRKEEGYVPRISAVLLHPDVVKESLRFAHQLPFTPNVLTKLAPAVERPGIHLGVWRTPAGLQIWGTIRTVPKHCFVLEVSSPGMLVIKQSRGEDSGKFVNVAVLEGDRVKVISLELSNEIDCPGPIRALLGFEEAAAPSGDVNPLVLLAVSMRAHARGGLLLVVPGNSERWRNSIIEPIRYSVSPPFTALADLVKEVPADDRKWQEALHRSIAEIAGLTAVDGATVISESYELLAFGAKIGRAHGAKRIEQVMVTEPIVGAAAEIVHPAQMGGTRHLWAAQFAQDQPDALTLVASQDGRFTLFAWSACEEMVHAHRVESLLL